MRVAVPGGDGGGLMVISAVLPVLFTVGLVRRKRWQGFDWLECSQKSSLDGRPGTIGSWTAAFTAIRHATPNQQAAGGKSPTLVRCQGIWYTRGVHARSTDKSLN